LVNSIPPVIAVLIGFVAFGIAMALQLSRMRYVAWAYWLAVVMVGVFGTMVADVLHVGFGIPYLVSTILFALILAAVFITWRAVEGTLSIHTVDSSRREVFYWLAVVATFALGTAAGDLTAVVFGLGYFGSALVFVAVILIPAIGFAVRKSHAVLAFWFAYVVTRPIGASLADWFGKPVSVGGLGVGSGLVALVLTLVIIGFVIYLSISRVDALQGSVRPRRADVRATR
jgi:uncharacterized membrane-anchored protein